jgi:hypothetical protein
MSQENLPDAAKVKRAIAIYMDRAYQGTQPPSAAQNLLNTLRDWSGDFYSSPAFARTGYADRPRLSVRLGNRFYPHMKLVLEPAPTGSDYLFKADTHDRHIEPPPGHPELGVFLDLRAKNKAVSEEIEQAWADAGLATFKTFLHADLARRQQEQLHHHSSTP